MKKSEQNIVRTVQSYALNAKFAEYVFLPSNAIEGAFWGRDYNVDPQFVTSDKIVCKPTFISTTNNAEGRYDESFDRICRSHFNMSFSAVRSIWIARLGGVDNYWHLIKLERI